MPSMPESDVMIQAAKPTATAKMRLSWSVMINVPEAFVESSGDGSQDMSLVMTRVENLA